MSENEVRPVVVGVDGSAAGQAALKWAVEDARRRGCRVDVISAWHPNYGILIGPVPAEVVMGMAPEAMRAAAQEGLDHAVEGFDGVEMRRVLVEGDPRTALVEASEDAELLVVGNRGHSTIVEAVLGSVSSYCVHHAKCPVVVIREPKAARQEERPTIEAALPLTPGPLL
ncbi:universal stress protein [Lentzea flaviverrucosa]|uniref:Nucleotide-binding universal stress protein, UspA family n=1 Tax=Lentzea flaviverrucosa TaxID=200379 RepID=A0A1H9XXW0_9PSEU|nr:universal stress protein [Lentzea flaviverrucosa]RDI34316.1 nucleotide-binding universal stress UspA family protein [Lentzea flaviverrucosa]SES50513.1 Nucleotide-binding universal stress protein, UspA family [Lentzea flaviverrucosa]